MKAFGIYKEKEGSKQIPVFCNLEVKLDEGKAIIKNLKPSILEGFITFGDVFDLIYEDPKDNKPKNILLEILTEKAINTYETKIIKLTENRRRFPRFYVRDLNVRVIVADHYFGFLRDISLRGFALDMKKLSDKIQLKRVYPVKILFNGEAYKFSTLLIGIDYEDKADIYILRFRLLESLRNINLIDKLYKKLFERKLRTCFL